MQFIQFTVEEVGIRHGHKGKDQYKIHPNYPLFAMCFSLNDYNAYTLTVYCASFTLWLNTGFFCLKALRCKQRNCNYIWKTSISDQGNYIVKNENEM